MKRILLAIALFASVTVANAQQSGVKSVAAAQKAVEKAIEKTENPKQAAKPDTWIKLAKSYVDAYNAPMGNGWIGATRQDLALILGEDRPSSEEWVEIQGQQFIKAVFETRDYYYNEQEVLSMIIVTKPVYADALEQALAAYEQAYACDDKGKKAKDIREGLQVIASKFTQDAYNAYTLGDTEKATYCFEMAVKASETKPCEVVDTNAVYNSALLSYLDGAALEAKGDTVAAQTRYDKAESYYKKCLDLKYYSDGGDVFAKLADLEIKKGNKEAGRDYLEQAFQMFPQSQSILVGLINFYMTSGENTDRLFQLVDAAKQNEPNNASLYYVEGNIYLELGREDEAVAAYSKCSEINPDYEFGYIGVGQLYYNKAVRIQEEAAQILDDAEYEARVQDFMEALKSCIEPFELAFAITKDDSIKVAIAEYLKNACYRFSDDPVYAEKYKKYNAVVKGE